MPSGNMWTGTVERIARTNAALGGNLSELLSTPIRPVSGTTVYLRDIGTIENGTDLVTAYAHVNGKRTVYIPVTKRADASTLDGDQRREGGDPRLQESRARRRGCAPGIRSVALRHQLHPRPDTRRAARRASSPA